MPNQSLASPPDFVPLGPSTIDRTDRYAVASNIVDQEFLIDVALPYSVPEGVKLPVIFVLDGPAQFALATSVARTLQAGPFPLPPAIIVGIGYMARTPEEEVRAIHLRVRDMSPWVDQSVEARYRTAPAPWTLPADIHQGGADDFAAFIEDELKPFIQERYPADPDDATLVGMSLGGLFALHVLFSTPASFRRYVAASPGLYWDERRIFTAEAALAARVQDLPAHLFLSVGGLEEAMDVSSRFVSNVYELEARLRQRAYPGLQMSFHVFPDETHMSVFPAALSRGLTAVFGGHRNVNDWGRVLEG